VVGPPYDRRFFPRQVDISAAKGGADLRRYIPFASIATLLTGYGLAHDVETNDVEAFRHALEQDGLPVQEGELSYIYIVKLYNAGVLPSAYGNNPATKYLLFFVPPGYVGDERIPGIARTPGLSANVSPFRALGRDVEADPLEVVYEEGKKHRRDGSVYP